MSNLKSLILGFLFGLLLAIVIVIVLISTNHQLLDYTSLNEDNNTDILDESSQTSSNKNINLNSNLNTNLNMEFLKRLNLLEELPHTPKYSKPSLLDIRRSIRAEMGEPNFLAMSDEEIKIIVQIENTSYIQKLDIQVDIFKLQLKNFISSSIEEKIKKYVKIVEKIKENFEAEEYLNLSEKSTNFLKVFSNLFHSLPKNIANEMSDLTDWFKFLYDEWKKRPLFEILSKFNKRDKIEKLKKIILNIRIFYSKNKKNSENIEFEELLEEIKSENLLANKMASLFESCEEILKKIIEIEIFITNFIKNVGTLQNAFDNYKSFLNSYNLINEYYLKNKPNLLVYSDWYNSTRWDSKIKDLYENLELQEKKLNEINKRFDSINTI